MKRKNRRNRMSAFLAAMVLTILCVCRPASAAERGGIDPDQPITLTIDLEAPDKCAAIFLYRVGEWDGSIGAYKLTEEFSGSGAKLQDTTASAVLQASEALERYAEEQNKQEIASQTTRQGIAVFTGLSDGLYLICQRRGASDNVTISPFLTTLPVMDEEKHVWNYDVKAYPKNEPDRPTPTEPDDPTPTKPDDPTPTEPDDPTPTEPDDPTPTKPDNPTPTEPDRPDRPDKPDKPDKPGGTDPTEPGPGQPTPGAGGDAPTPDPPPSVTEEEVPTLPLAIFPRTGDGSISYMSLVVILAVSAVLILGLIRKRRKQEE